MDSIVDSYIILDELRLMLNSVNGMNMTDVNLRECKREKLKELAKMLESCDGD